MKLLSIVKLKKKLCRCFYLNSFMYNISIFLFLLNFVNVEHTIENVIDDYNEKNPYNDTQTQYSYSS